MSLFLRIIIIHDEEESVDGVYAWKQFTWNFVDRTEERKKEILK